MPELIKEKKTNAFVKKFEPEIGDLVHVRGPGITKEAIEEAVRIEAMEAARHRSNRVLRGDFRSGPPRLVRAEGRRSPWEPSPLEIRGLQGMRKAPEYFGRNLGGRQNALLGESFRVPRDPEPPAGRSGGSGGEPGETRNLEGNGGENVSQEKRDRLKTDKRGDEDE